MLPHRLQQPIPRTNTGSLRRRQHHRGLETHTKIWEVSELPNTELRPGIRYPAWQAGLCIASSGVACPTKAPGELRQGYNDRMTDLRVAQANVAYIEQRIPEIDVEILAIEQSISLALQNCPCLWSTEFP